MDSLSSKPKVLILGTGIAGASAALKLASHAEVTIVSKAQRLEGATRYAQGGIASVWSEQDSFEAHIKDTLNAGAGLCHEEVVGACVREGPLRVRELIDLGVPFTKVGTTSDYDLHREGGHGQRRILHADDLTGLAIVRTLHDRIREHPSIRVLEDSIAIDLITEGKLFKAWRSPGRCLGAYVLNTKTGKVETLASDVTILATGGAGKVYLYTTNPDSATGDGIAIAYRAGARVANLEFMQFHPTCLYHPDAKNFLITEALRGEGAILRTIAGDEFMSRHHPMGSLAPRDVVARAIDIEMKRTGDRHVMLDATAIDSQELRSKFPNIHETCLRYGIDFTTQAIPVVPAAHYACGGVYVNHDGQTSIEGLYAVGEVACSGLHGANRLASNSLLEAVVFAHRVSEHAAGVLSHRRADARMPEPLPEWDTGSAVALEEKIDIAALWFEIRALMWNYVGIVRSNRRLERARRRLELIQSEVEQYYWDFILTKDLIELRNLILVAQLIVQCAMLRKESRGLHYTADYPEMNDEFYRRDTVL